ncbi:Translation initiation factor IF-2 [Novipirellula galeiformis]|uniref:Translation initiation factor IF-2 n=1 Tax=Novipirellula galeiformis TaxID=2528004 RepID=A0A5C6C9T6_9BACT|nr:translation initiation factor IF-2 [Novipirellula galeiformis]TWU20948.1 Translation initiation factor IF-2 [Novipirellula galeiformis]
MPARIYALAKELNLDSKDLVDIVRKVGITGKGSALASLTDEETQKVRDHLAGSAKAAPPKAPVVAKATTSTTAPVAAVRDSVVPEKRKPVAIQIGRPSKAAKPEDVGGSKPAAPAPIRSPRFDDSPTSKKTAAEAAAKAAAEAAAAAEVAAAKASARKAAEPEAKPKNTPKDKPSRKSGVSGIAARVADKIGFGTRTIPTGNVDRSAPVAAVRPDSASPSGGGIRSLDRPASSGGGDKKGSKPKRREPRINVKMAALGDAPEAAVPKSAPGEPKAQKPDIKLSKDVIAGHKQGMKAPLEQIAQDDADSKRGGTRKIGSGGLSGFTGEKGHKGGKAVEEEDKPRKKGLSGMASARAERARGSSGGGGRRRHNDSFDRGGRESPYRRRTLKRKGTNTAAPRKEKIQLELPCTVRSFSEAAGVPVAQVLRTLMGMQIMVNINAQLDFETAELVAAEMDLDIELKASETLEEELITELEEKEDSEESLVARAPIVTFLGHVDHGKTSLLDYLVGINVARGEAGGITQHIRAYEVDKDGRKVTFVDTPGHEAFTEMRARGANVTDIAVLVIAADDGIMPQTAEAISHAKAAGVPIVVALNKIDLEGVDVTRVLTQLTEHQLTPSEWGGDVEVVRTSATKGTGMDELLETLLTIAEMQEYRANPTRKALGVCIESEQQGNRGVVAKLVVQNGTLRVGDILVCGPSHGRVRSMKDTLTGKNIKQAGPSTPVNITGLDQAPGAGDRFHVLKDIGQAREIAETRESASSRESLSGITTKVSFENFQEMLAGGKIGVEDRVKLNLIIRADVKGSLEAIEKELSKFDHPEVELRILQKSVGSVSLADITLASASDAVVLAFNVIPDDKARSLADDRGIEIRRYQVIYKLADDIKALIEGRLKPEERVVELGRALVKQVFQISRVGTIAGCYVAQGVIQRGCRIRVNRDGRTIGDYPLDTVKRIKEDVKEVPRGMECGIRLSGFNDIKQDDVLEAYRIEEVARTLD